MRPVLPALATCLAVLATAGCQLVVPFDSSELGCPCPAGYSCEYDRCRYAGDTEDTIGSCRDGVDNDEDGAEDCEDQQCIDIGACDQFPAECDPFTAVGCPAGLTCALSRDGGGRIITVCREIGQRHVGETCVRDGDPAEVCLPGAACVLSGSTGVEAICQELCSTDADCGDYAICGYTLDGIDYGLCTTPCLPWAPRTQCREGYICRPVTFPESEHTVGGPVTTCLHPTVLPVFGDLTVGEECVPTSTAREDLCNESLMCAPIAGDNVCVSYCDPDTTPSPSCEPCLSLVIGRDEVIASYGRPVGVCYGDAN